MYILTNVYSLDLPLFLSVSHTIDKYNFKILGGVSGCGRGGSQVVGTPEAEVDFCEFKTSLVYRWRSKTAEATEKPCLGLGAWGESDKTKPKSGDFSMIKMNKSLWLMSPEGTWVTALLTLVCKRGTQWP